jgi:uncharacterized protein
LCRKENQSKGLKIMVRRFRLPILLAAMLVVVLANAGVNLLVAPIPVLALPVGVGLIFACVWVYRWLSRTVEGRVETPELATAGLWTPLRRGLLLGAGMFTTVMVLIAIFGGWDSFAWGSIWGFLGTGGMMASVAVAEELLFRGVLFRLLEQHLGTVLTLVVSSVLFGLTHLVNVNATLWGTLSIGLTGGLLTAAAYVVTRSLWLPIGLHFAWNFTHAGIFGVALSGSSEAPHGLFNTTLSGPSVITGGVFGPEASLLALAVCVVPTVLLLRRAARTGQIRKLHAPGTVKPLS